LIFVNAWKEGDLRSNPLAGPYRRLSTEDTSENKIKDTGENYRLLLQKIPGVDASKLIAAQLKV
jgi:hypothetical protein